MTRSNQLPWERVLRELHREFSLLERELSLLQDIDQSILNMDTNDSSARIKDLFLDTLERFSEIHHTESPLLCYVNLESQFKLLTREGEEPQYPTTISFSRVFRDLSPESEPRSGRLGVVSAEEDAELFSFFQNEQTILTCPMFSEQKLLLCVFLMADRSEKALSHLSDPAFCNSVVTLVSQLAIAHNHHNRARQHKKVDDLWSTFVQSDLSPTKCFKEIAHHVPNFLPSFGPIEFQGHGPHVQIMMLSKDLDLDSSKKELIIRGTTGQEPEGTRISLDRSISGLLLESNMPYFCDDPTKPEYKNLYREYLGKGRIHTELAVRLVINEKPIGVLNLESETPYAFNLHHINAILRLSETIAPISLVLEHRLEMNSAMQRSVASSTARYLKGIASVFNHSITTPLEALRTNIEFGSDKVLSDSIEAVSAARNSTAHDKELVRILERLDQNLQDTNGIFARLSDVESQLSTYTTDFLSDIGSYGESGPTNLVTTIEAALALVRESLLRGKTIELEFVGKPTDTRPMVFASPLLKQHLYSIFANAVSAIQERQLEDDRPGLISIAMSEESPPDSQESKLNSAWVISIRDNGKGVDSTQLRELNQFNPGTRFRKDPGQGFGLVAAQRYIASIGGRIKLNSESGKFFEVILHFTKEDVAGLQHSEA